MNQKAQNGVRTKFLQSRKTNEPKTLEKHCSDPALTFDAALSSIPDWIHITSFNELAEHTHIEPTREFGWFYIDMTAKFGDEFKRRKGRINQMQQPRR